MAKGGGFGIFTDRDQRSIVGVLNFENLYFWGTAHSCCIFGGLLDKNCILSVSYFNII